MDFDDELPRGLVSGSWTYILLDPRDGTVRYVGSASNPRIRRKSHMTIYPREEIWFGHLPYFRWKKELIDAGYKPIFRVIEKSNREKWWIFALANLPINSIKKPFDKAYDVML